MQDIELAEAQHVFEAAADCDPAVAGGREGEAAALGLVELGRCVGGIEPILGDGQHVRIDVGGEDQGIRMGPAAKIGGERCGDRIGLLTRRCGRAPDPETLVARRRADQRRERDLLEVLEMVLLAVEGRVVRGERIEQARQFHLELRPLRRSQ